MRVVTRNISGEEKRGWEVEEGMGGRRVLIGTEGGWGFGFVI